MKEIFEQAELTLNFFLVEDVITASNVDQGSFEDDPLIPTV